MTDGKETVGLRTVLGEAGCWQLDKFITLAEPAGNFRALCLIFTVNWCSLEFSIVLYLLWHPWEKLSGCLSSSKWLGRRRQWHPNPVLLPGKSHGQRSLVGCSPWGRKESDTTERLHFDFSLSCIGEGNGNPLQCSCLENPRDGADWWAAVYGVAQSRT